MAIYHFSAKVVSRATGRSAVAAVAYRSGSALHDERLGRAHDFTGKAGGVHSEILLPAGAPAHLADRAALWNAVEAGEKRKDAQLAREVEVALPRELPQAEAVRLAHEFVRREFVERGIEIGRTITRIGTDYHMAIGDDVLEGVPIFVLVDEGTGAGAELVAGALQASGRALLAGRGTRGAATLQTVMPLARDHGALRLTTGRLTLADGLEFACRGLDPEIRFDAPARHAAFQDVPGRAGCDGPSGTAIRLLSAESCPVPGGEALRSELACVIHALRTFVLAAASRR